MEGLCKTTDLCTEYYPSTSLFRLHFLPLVVKTSTSHTDKEPSTPTSCRNTCWPTSVRAHVNVLVTPSSVTRILVGISSNMKYRGVTWAFVVWVRLVLKVLIMSWRERQISPSQRMRKPEVDWHESKMRKPEVDDMSRKLRNTKNVSCIAVPKTAALAQRKPASAGTSNSCDEQDSDKRTLFSNAAVKNSNFAWLSLIYDLVCCPVLQNHL
jgi:hypothetical protein